MKPTASASTAAVSGARTPACRVETHLDARSTRGITEASARVRAPHRLKQIVGALLALGILSAESRPRYGGTLRVEMSAVLSNLDPAEIPSDPAVLQAKARLVPAVFETLVRFDDNGVPQPWLATAWAHDAARKRWVFTPRVNVRLHNGTIWTPAAASLEVADDRPIDQILREMAQPWNAIVVRESDGSLTGTGPFRVAKWEGGRAVTLAANEGHWKGRPYLDSVEIQMGRDLRDQAQDFQLGKADVVEASPGTGEAMPNDTLALVFDTPRTSPSVREAISLSIDRAIIRRVLLKGHGEISGALLPQWLSGYAFLFEAKRDVARARQLAAGAPPLTFAYDRQDAVLRSLGERISVNAMEAGITMRPGNGAADVRLIALPVASRDELAVLADMAVILKAPFSFSSAPYEAERALLDGFHVVPLFHLTRSWNLAPRLQNWPDLPNVWIGLP
jgi:MarR-like DNA-binding transcriptional regulator SgrR of sgrS sRNA